MNLFALEQHQWRIRAAGRTGQSKQQNEGAALVPEGASAVCGHGIHAYFLQTYVIICQLESRISLRTRRTASRRGLRIVKSRKIRRLPLAVFLRALEFERRYPFLIFGPIKFQPARRIPGASGVRTEETCREDLLHRFDPLPGPAGCKRSESKAAGVV